jgi:hypothetical protein
MLARWLFALTLLVVVAGLAAALVVGALGR